MANTLSAQFDVTGSGTLTEDLALSDPVDSVAIGTGIDEITIALADGTGTDQANEWWHGQRTVAATTMDSFDIRGTALQNGFGQNIAFTTLKVILLKIVSPDGTKSLRFGPQAQATPFTGPYGDASDYETFNDFLFKVNRYAGWTVGAGATDIMYVYNPGAAGVTYQIWLLGTK